jgi:hypothetical protein
MRFLFSILTVVSISVLFVACSAVTSQVTDSSSVADSVTGTSSVTTANVTMSEVDPALASYEGDPEMDILVTNPVTYDMTGSDLFDTFFHDSAVVYATTVASDGIMAVTVTRLQNLATRVQLTTNDDLQQLLQTLIDNRGQIAPEDFPELNQTIQTMNGLATTLQAVPQNGQTLLEQIPTLTEQASSEFQSQPTTLATVQDALSSSQTNLTSAVESAPTLAERATQIGQALGQVVTAPAN